MDSIPVQTLEQDVTGTEVSAIASESDITSMSKMQEHSSQRQQVDELRQQGNFQFQSHQYDAAIALYTEALAMDPRNTVLLCNRSACWFQLEEYHQAARDAHEALMLGGSDKIVFDRDTYTDSSNYVYSTGVVSLNNLKAAYRLAKTLIAMEEFLSANHLIKQSLIVLETHTDKELPKSVWSQTPSLEEQQKSFQDLLQQLQQLASAPKAGMVATQPEPTKVADIAQLRALSIREFTKGIELGYGNFSQVLIVTHKVSGEKFALKLIEKKQAQDLAKRQHPNVYNEIRMEQKVLMERISPHPRIIRMIAAFQNFTTIFYLMELCHGDLWSELKHRQKLVGCHATQARYWMWQLVDAVEHLHSHGIVHRDLKPENVLLKNNQIVVIDFGTAKDLIERDFNGPEFVGTPDFMSPEAVAGNSNSQDESVSTPADLWAIGAILYILATGKTPFWSPSPYLTFLRVKRCNLTRDAGIYDDGTWDLITQLLRKNPDQRLGSSSVSIQSLDGGRSISVVSGGYDCIRRHSYFDQVRIVVRSHDTTSASIVFTPVPSLVDLCYRAVADQVELESQDIAMCDRHPPGDGSSHDMMRLSPNDRTAVLHVLDRLTCLRDSCVYKRFFTDPVLLLISKVRPATRDFVGLTQMNDDGCKPPRALMNDPHTRLIEGEATIEFVHVTSPLFSQIPPSDDVRKEWMKLLKAVVSTINRRRPQLVICCGKQLMYARDNKVLKILARISESIPVVIVDGNHFFHFYFRGVECMAVATHADDESQTRTTDNSPQNVWIRERVEQSRLSKHPVFCFTASNPHALSKRFIQRLVRGRALAMYGPGLTSQTDTVYYAVNESVDHQTFASDSSEDDEKDNFQTTISSSNLNGLRWIKVEESPDEWSDRFEEISLIA